MLRQRADPRRFWIAWRPEERADPDALPGWRVDLARAVLVRDRPRLAAWVPPPGIEIDDVVYVPPGAAEVAGALRASGAPVVVQRMVGEEVPAPAPDLLPVVDLSDEASFEAASPGVQERAPGAFACWPLLPGAVDEMERFAALCLRLRALGYAGVRALALDLSPEDRRALAERRPERFEAIFHRAPPDESLERRCDEIAAAAGLATTVPRPLPLGSAPRRVIANRRVAEALATSADAARRSGRSEASVAALLRAQRMADATTYDLEALAREGNLGVLDWLDEQGRRVALAAVEGGGGLPPPPAA
jgi:hypothetical protein